MSDVSVATLHQCLRAEIQRRSELPYADQAALTTIDEMVDRHAEDTTHRCVPGRCQLRIPLMQLARRWELFEEHDDE